MLLLKASPKASLSTHALAEGFHDCFTLPCFQRKASIEAKNEAETQIYSAESSLREYKDKLPQNIQDSINTEISNVRSSLESEDAEDIRSKVPWALRLLHELAVPHPLQLQL